jgi:2-octaprenyl-6-methoxyphenol hydroxylase
MAREQLNSLIECDLAIVGGGIVGATLAAALKASGLKIAIIEAQTQEQAAARRQAYALSLLSGKIFAGIGIWQEILPNIGKFQHIRLSDGNYPRAVQFQTGDLGTQFLGYVGEHRTILTALQAFLADCPNIHWLCPAEVTGVEYGETGAEIAIKQGEQQYQVRAKLVIGADGARSRIRQWAGIQTRGWKYWQSCITFTIKHSAPRNDIAFERFCDTGPMGILPLPGNRCQIVWTAPHAQAKALKELDEPAFLANLAERTGNLLGELELIGDRNLFPVQLMQSARYVQPRLALVGDAAHCCHPVGGQGLNLGIRDAAALAQVLEEARERGEDIGDIRVLRRYERWRKRENLMILGFTDLLDRLFSHNFLPLVLARRCGLLLLQYLVPFRIYALQLMVGFRGQAPHLSQRNLAGS